MKTDRLITGLRKHLLLVTLPLLIAAPYQTSYADNGAKNNSVRKITRSKHIIPGKTASKLAIIAAVKEKYKGRILKVRKRPSYYGKNCHHVKMIDSKGEFLLIKVACKNVKKKK